LICYVPGSRRGSKLAPMADETPLITGWEPQLPVEDSVLRQFVFSYADRAAATAHAAGGAQSRTDLAVYADARSAFFFDNAIVLLQPPTDARLDAVLGRAAEVFPPERPWVLLSAWPTPDLRPRGLALVGHPPLMLRPPGGTPPPHPPHLMIRRVADVTRLAEFTRVLVEGYPMPQDAQSTVFTLDLLDGPIELYVGYVRGEPVACGGASVAHGLIEVDWIATLPEHRGHGYGTALTWAAATVRRSLPAVLISSDNGAPIYRRLGFYALQRCTLWLREAAARRTDAAGSEGGASR
jgi:GNAT superfamily N-acetyltransferase